MTPEILNGICQHIDAESTKQVLWVSTSPNDVPTDLPCTHCSPEESALLAEENRQYDFAVLAELPGNLSKSSAESVIARMRDVNAQKVFWVISEDSPWNDKDALAFGFHQLQQDRQHRLFGFDIDNYKTTPDWLNAKHWANPERWGKERW